MKKKLCFKIIDIELIQNGRDKFTVKYGLQVKKNLCYEEAASELGACIMHSLACFNELDNRMPGER